MTAATDTLQWISLVLYSFLGAAMLRRWMRTRQASSAWAAITFGSLTAVLVVGHALPEDTAIEEFLWLVRILIVILALFPYLVYRFAASFVAPPRWIERTATVLTLIVIAATFAVPSFPKPEEPKPLWYGLFTIAFLAQWVFLFTVAGTRLWRAGRGRPPVIRRRVRILAAGAAGMNLALVISVAAASSDPTPMTLIQQIIGLLATVAFVIGLAPPRMLRNEWRRQQEGVTQAMMVALMAAERPEQVASTILPYSTNVLGLRGLALVSSSGEVLGAVGIEQEQVRRALAVAPDDRARAHLIAFDGRYATLIGWADPYAPFFAPDDLELIHAMGSVTDMVLERCAKIAYERRFIANAAHELRTPLTALSGLSVTLATRRHQMAEPEIEECFRALERQGDRTRVLIENLLDLAQLDHGVPDLDPRAVPVAQVASRALEMVPPPDGVSVRLNIDRWVHVEADESRLEQMLVNLLTNAYRYGGPNISVEAFSDVGGALVVVSDDGPGVPDELLPQLFEPFGRGSVGSNKGSGLGLAIVQRLVTAFGGDVWYEPAQPTGARFTIRLKAA